MRSKLFVPASRPELFPKALAGDADAISFDLEDAVAEDRKVEARNALRACLLNLPATCGKQIIVRVNALDSAHFHDDIHALADTPVNVLNIPKVEDLRDMLLADEQLRNAGIAPDVGILANIETAKGLRLAHEISSHPRVEGLQLGLADLFEPLNIDRYDEHTVRSIMLQLRLAAGEHDKYVMDTAYARIRDGEGFKREANLARSLGFVGKSCVHPSQVAIANDVFVPTEAEIEQAKRIVEASAQHAGQGAFMLDGKMIDAPFIKRAEAILRSADQPS